MAEVRRVVLRTFLDDLVEVALWSEEHFGTAAGDRYIALITQAMRDVQDNPVRPGAKARPDLASDAYVYHLIHSRDRSTNDSVRKPRHFILYRFRDSLIEFARLLHDSRDLSRHLPDAFL